MWREDRENMATVLFFLVPTTMLIAGLLFFSFPLTDLQRNALFFPLFGGLILLGLGFFMNDANGSILKTSGWILFSFYWATQPNTLFYYEGGDIVNAVICGIGVYVLFYFAYREWIGKNNKKNLPCVNWVAGATFIAGIIYFSFDNMPYLKDGLINIVTKQSAWLLSLFSDKIKVDGSLIWFGYNYEMMEKLGSYGATAQIIFACTAIQSMLLFIGMITALRGTSVKSRVYALLATVPTIYVLNLIRNAGVVFLSGSQIMNMNIAHNFIGKAGSLIALIILVFLVFKILPELYDYIICLFDLPKQDGPIERYFRNHIKWRIK